MGKRIITQRRGKGSLTYRAPSHRYKGKLKYCDYDSKSILHGKIIDIIHSPGHSAPLAKISYGNNKSSLISAPMDVRVNDHVSVGEKEIKAGNTLLLKDIPEGTPIYNIESTPNKITFCRSAGTFARIVSKSDLKVVIKLPSKKQKELNPNLRATIGIVAAGGKRDKPFVKAGKKWHAMHARGKLYPKTSGVAMNAVDHPFGSGRGRHVGKSKIPPRNAPAGRNIGLLRARRTGRRR